MNETLVDQIAAQIYRISTFVAAVPPTGLVFNRFLVLGDEPLLFHLGHRSAFAAAPQALVAHGALGCAVSISDMADRCPYARLRGSLNLFTLWQSLDRPVRL